MLKRAKYLLGFSGLALTVSGVLPLSVFADLCPKSSGGADFSAVCKLDLQGNLFGNVITIVFVVAILLALAYLIWGGIKWVLSGGDKAKVDAARGAIVAAIVGLIIVFLAYFIINIVVPVFVPGFSLQNLTLPTINGGSSSADGNAIQDCQAIGGTWNSSTNSCN